MVTGCDRQGTRGLERNRHTAGTQGVCPISVLKPIYGLSLKAFPVHGPPESSILYDIALTRPHSF